MKARNMLQLLVVVAVLVMPFAGMAYSDDSDAVAPEYAHYYYDQLSSNQKAIYDALEGLDPSSVTKTYVYGSATQDYAVKVTVGSTYVLGMADYASLKEAVFHDIAVAWQATLLDDPMAWWTWYSDDAGEVLYRTTFAIEGSPTSVTGITFYVYISEEYMVSGGTDMAQKVQAVKDALTEIKDSGKITGSDTVEIIRSINSYLCSSDYVYDDEAKFNGDVYGAFVAKDDAGVHHILCAGYARAFRALCDMYGIPCITVVGLSAQTVLNGGHMWNTVKVTTEIGGVSGTYMLGVDVTWNATCGQKELFLLNGTYTEADGITYSMYHQAFAPLNPDSVTWVEYCFTSPALNDAGYTFPKENDLTEVLYEYAPWILIGVVCLILAYILWNMAKRGE